MTPLDCMSIGYFLALLLRAGGKVLVYLSDCSIDDYSLGLLLKVFSRHAEVCPAGVMQAAVTKLDISKNNKITEIGIARIVRTNITSNLKADLCGIKKMESLARALAVNSTLKALDISGNYNIGDEGIGHIGTALLTNTTLNTLNITNCVSFVRFFQGTDRSGRVHICTALQKNTTLKILCFSGCKITDLEAKSLGRALAVNSSLEVLDISDNEIGDKGMGHIATALLTNTTLKILNISKCTYIPVIPYLYTDTSSNHMNGRVHICTALQTNTALKTLIISSCGISDLVAESLARALEVNSTLEELDISNNNIGDKGIGHIATALLTNITLKILNISKCVPAVGSSLEQLDMGGSHMNGRVHICTALQTNTALKRLNFSCCGMSDLLAESLARALEVNTSLEELAIIDDTIGDNGIAHIAKCLQKNNTLKSLHVGMEEYKKSMPVTGFTDTGVLSLARGVGTNTLIECLSIQWYSTDPESMLKMMAEGVKNSNLKISAIHRHVETTTR